MRVRGTIEKIDGNVLTVKNRAGETLTIKLADNARVLGMVKASLDDIKPGLYVGISALPQADGSQRALHVHFFLEAMRGVAEGFGPWDARPGSTMTNATIAEVTSVPDGRTLLVKYKGEEKKIVVPAEYPDRQLCARRQGRSETGREYLHHRGATPAGRHARRGRRQRRARRARSADVARLHDRDHSPRPYRR